MTKIIGSIAVLVVLAGIVALVVVGMIRERKRGKSSCGCGCSDCPMSGKCHGGKTADGENSG